MDHKLVQASKNAMVSVVTAAKDEYKKGMTENEFLNQVYGDVPVASRTQEGIGYFKDVFKYLDKGATDEEIMAKEDGSSLKAVLNLAKGSKEVANGFIDGDAKGWPWKEILKIAIHILGIIVVLIS
jgi:hypothetical protein